MNQAKQGETLQNQVDDATQKVALLLGEVEFNQNVVEILEQIRRLRQVLRKGQQAVQSESLAEAVDILLIAEHELNTLPAGQITKVYGLLLASVTEFRHDLLEKLTKFWKGFFQTDFTTTTFSIKHRLQSRQLALNSRLSLTKVRQYYHRCGHRYRCVIQAESYGFICQAALRRT